MSKLEGDILHEDIVRKTSKTVLHAAERRRKPLFDRLTAANANKIADIFKEKPIFYENRQDLPTQILIDDEIRDLMPDEFSKDPTKWIESQKNINRHHADEDLENSGENIGELWDTPYDVSRVKEFRIGNNEKNVNVVSKRVSSKQMEEIALSQKAYEAGLPVPKIYGIVEDKGNVYMLFEKMKAISLIAAQDRLGKESLIFRYDSTIVSHVFKEEAFWEGLKREKYYNIISENAKEELHLLWLKNRELIAQRELIVRLRYLASSVFHKINRDINYRKQIIEEIKREFGQIQIEAIAKKLGFDSFEAIDEEIKKTNILCDVDKMKWLDEIFGRSKEAVRETGDLIYKKFFIPYRAVLQKDLFSFEINKEIKRLKSLCDKKNISHKDLESRNILVEWDFENNRPLRKKGKKAKLYIIDWEPEKKSNKK